MTDSSLRPPARHEQGRSIPSVPSLSGLFATARFLRNIRSDT